jgi:cytochrome P450
MRPLIEEIRENGGDSQDFFHQLAVSKLPDTEGFVLECIRTKPATTLPCKFVSSTMEAGGHTIPEGWLAIVCPSVSQCLDSAYDDAGSFDPGRFADVSTASIRSVQAGLLAFGGGMQKYLGQRFGVNELKILLVGLLGRFALTQYPQTAKPRYSMVMTRPASPHRIRYRNIHYRRGADDGKVTQGDAGSHHQEPSREDRKVARGMGGHHA